MKLWYETTPAALRLVPIKNRHSTIDESMVVPVQHRSNFSIGPTMGGVKPQPASKPADPAFKNALRQRPMRIGLRYIGD